MTPAQRAHILTTVSERQGERGAPVEVSIGTVTRDRQIRNDTLLITEAPSHIIDAVNGAIYELNHAGLEDAQVPIIASITGGGLYIV